MYGINGKKFRRQYKKSLSDFKNWKQKPHAEDYILFSENCSENLSLDEVALSEGELYTVLTSKTARGRKGSIVAIIKGTKSENVIEKLMKSRINDIYKTDQYQKLGTTQKFGII